MIDDPAFVWSSGKEGVRRIPRPEATAPSAVPTITPPAPQPATPAPPRSAPPGRVTLREAEAATGIPATTLRNWAKKERISSVIDLRDGTGMRLVDLDEVVERGKMLGRLDPEFRVTTPTLSPTPSTTGPPEMAPATSRPPAQPRADSEQAPAGPGTGDPDLEAGVSPREAVAAEAPESAPPAIPEGTMLVPLDAWDKMLRQLGNLHEAGQQLAAASERAAKAETEALFLRERLREVRDDRERLRDEQDRLRADRDRLEQRLGEAQRRPAPGIPGPAPRPPTRRSMWTALYRTLRGR